MKTTDQNIWTRHIHNGTNLPYERRDDGADMYLVFYPDDAPVSIYKNGYPFLESASFDTVKDAISAVDQVIEGK